MKNFFLFLFFSVLLTSCARVGSPVGGKKDSLAPVMLGSNIDTPRINVSRTIKELRIDFNEYIKLDNVNKNLIISPQIKKVKKILPSSLANKYILIQWQDTLQENTTYSFNFGNAIKDNNENNTLPYFTFAFSTGNKIDDTYISGDVKNLITSSKTSSKEKSDGSSGEKSIVIGLYKDKDTIDYKQKPYYITKADQDGYYEINYISPGAYKLIAFEDSKENSLFDTGVESIGFLKDKLVVDKSVSGLNINLYPSKSPFKYLDMKENEGGIMMLFEGNPENVKVLSLNENIKDYKIIHKPKSDTVNIWFDAKAQNVGIDKSENLKFSYDTGIKQDTVSLFYKLNPKNEMTLANAKGNLLAPKKSFVFKANYIIDKIDTEKWVLVSDSISQPFSAKISDKNPYQVVIDSDFKEGKKYSLTVPKNTVYSYYESNLKSYRFDFEEDKSENYGVFTAKIINKPKFKFWIELLNSSGEVTYSKYTTDDIVKFTEIKPDTYSLRILVDNNENGYWDSADFYNSIFAEDVYVFTKKIVARPLWEIVEEWDLTAPPKKTPENDKNNTKQPPVNSKIQGK